MTFGGLTAYVLTFLLFLPKADPNVVDWVVVGDPCTAIHEAHKI